jgi:AraC-like DNA-binding protein
LKFELLRFLLYFVGSISTFTSVILVFKGSVWPLNHRLMGLVFLISNIFIVSSYLVLNGSILAFPHLFRAFSPTYYLIGPLLYFYFRGAVFHKKILWKKDWFHFLPAFLQLIDLIPFYIKTGVEKREILEKIVLDSKLVSVEGSGFLDVEFHVIIRFLILAAYLIYLFFLIFSHRQRIYNFENGKSFFQLLILILIVFLLGNIISGFFLYNSFYSELVTNPSVASFGIFVLIACSLILYLFLHGFIFFMPETTFRLADPSRMKKFEELKKRLEDQSSMVDNKLDLETNESLLSKLELGMKVEKWFKINGLTVEECAKKLECERYVLSKLINRYHNMRFNDYVNLHRVAFIKEEIKRGSTKKITLEGLAEEAGFNSRTTFYKAFIKHEGLSPQEFLKSI